MIDRETGEVLTPKTVYVRSDEVALVINPRENGRSKKFIKIFNSREAKRVIRKLSLQENGCLFLFAYFLAQNTNIIVGDGEFGTRGVPLTLTQLSELAKISKPTMIKVAKSLAEKNIMRSLGRGKGYAINPNVMLNGSKPDTKLAKLFADSI